MKKLNDIEKKRDQYSMRSSNQLKNFAETQIRKVFVSCLSYIEMRFGKDFEGYEQIRSNILRTGNDAIRDLRSQIDENFNVEAIPDKLTVHFTNEEKVKRNGL